MSVSIFKQIRDGNNNFFMFEDSSSGSSETPSGRAKKRRLDHLTWEEKLQRKKLKNRVAAQTSRDRKKARMEQMESALNELASQNDAVLAECERLRRLNEKLIEENEKIRKRLDEPCAACSRDRSVERDDRKGSTVSDLLPKGAVASSAADPRRRRTQQPEQQEALGALWKILVACLLYRTSSTSSTRTLTLAPSSSSPRVCYRISPQTWRRLLESQIAKNQRVVDRVTLKQWWGRHQNTWNPMEVSA